MVLQNMCPDIQSGSPQDSRIYLKSELQVSAAGCDPTALIKERNTRVNWYPGPGKMCSRVIHSNIQVISPFKHHKRRERKWSRRFTAEQREKDRDRQEEEEIEVEQEEIDITSPSCLYMKKSSKY